MHQAKIILFFQTHQLTRSLGLGAAHPIALVDDLHFFEVTAFYVCLEDAVALVFHDHSARQQEVNRVGCLVIFEYFRPWTGDSRLQ